MRDPSDPPTVISDLVVECLERIEAEGSGALEELCAEHPDHADALRRRIQTLAAVGLMKGEGESDLPEVIGPYRILDLIGRGGMGVVYRAQHIDSQEQVALKIVRNDTLMGSEDLEWRFEREIEVVSRISSEQVVGLRDHGLHNGLPYLVMDHVPGVALDSVTHMLQERNPVELEGHDLLACLRRLGPETETDETWFARTWNEVVLDIVIEVTRAMVHAHEAGIVHRDLKPANVMLTAEGKVKVLDFGLALLSGATRFTSTGIPVGSLPYLAPEQVEGRSEEIGEASDVYAMGVLMYELWTLHLPFLAPNAGETIQRVVRGRAPSPRRRNPTLTSEAEFVVRRAMDVESAHRYPSAAALLEDLLALRAGQPVAARAPSVLRRGRRWVSQNPLLPVGGTALILVITALLAWLHGREQTQLADEHATRQSSARRAQAEETVNRLLALSGTALVELPREGQTARLQSLQMAVETWRPLVEESPGDHDVLSTWARLHRAVGALCNELGRSDEALRAYATGEAAAELVLGEDPTHTSARIELATIRSGKGFVHRVLGDHDEALLLMTSSLELWDELIEERPDHHQSLTNQLGALSASIRLRRIAGENYDADLVRAGLERARAFESRVDTTDDGRLAYIIVLLACAHWALAGQDDAMATTASREALLAIEAAPASSSDLRRARAQVDEVRTEVEHRAGDRTSCARRHDFVVETFEAEYADFPASTILAKNLSSALTNRGVCRLKQGNRLGVIDLEQALEIANALPESAVKDEIASFVELNLAQSRLDSDPEGALHLALRGMEYSEIPVDGTVLSEAARQRLGSLVHAAGVAYARLGRLREATLLLEQYADYVAEGDGWYTRLMADCWNEWCLAYPTAEEPDELDPALAEERLFEFLERAVDEGYGDRRELETTAALDAYREDERFDALLARMPR